VNKFFFGDEELPGTLLGKREVVRDPAGIWRYVETWIPVPGARDVTLTERFSPKFVINGDREVERVVVEGAAIAAAPELLGWCLEEGTVLRDGGSVAEVHVPYELWKQRDQILNELFSPEHEGDVAEQEVAAAERRFRETERRFELAAKERAAMLRRHADGMTRQKAREITGLSVGRVQQLISSGAMDMAEREVLELFASGPIRNLDACFELAREKGVPLDRDALLARVEDLKNRELLEQGEGPEVALTDKGAGALLEARVLGQQVELEV
jgi:hypothetical protein